MPRIEPGALLECGGAGRRHRVAQIGAARQRPDAQPEAARAPHVLDRGRHVRARRFAACLCVFTIGCDEGSTTPVYRTEEAVVHADVALCAPHLAYLDAHIRQAEQILEAESDELVDVTVFDALPVPGCPAGTLGCYRREPDEVRAMWSAVDHEVVHAVGARIAEPLDPFWREGLAEAVSGRRTQAGLESVLDSLDDEPHELSYATAGHFVRWLIETHGVEHMPALARGAPFSDIYEINIEAAAETYESTAPWSYPARDSCDFEAIELDENSATTADVVVACDDATAPDYLFLATHRTMRLDQGGEFELRVDRGIGVFIMACQLDVLVDEPDSDFVGDVLREGSLATGPLPGLPTFFESDVTHALHLEAGAYRFTFQGSEELAPQTMSLEFRRIGE